MPRSNKKEIQPHIISIDHSMVESIQGALMRPVFLKAFSWMAIVILVLVGLTLFSTLGIVVYRLGIYVIQEASETFVLCLAIAVITSIVVYFNYIVNYGRKVIDGSGNKKVELSSEFPI